MGDSENQGQQQGRVTNADLLYLCRRLSLFPWRLAQGITRWHEQDYEDAKELVELCRKVGLSPGREPEQPWTDERVAARANEGAAEIIALVGPLLADDVVPQRVRDAVHRTIEGIILDVVDGETP